MKRQGEMDENVKISIKYSTNPREFRIIKIIFTLISYFISMHKHDIQNNSGMNVTISGFDVKRRDELDKNVKISIKYSASPRKFKIIFTWD